jgi:hypothetical protein
MPREYTVIPLFDRFLSKIDKQENGCWIWTAYKDKDGYGSIQIDKLNKIRSHRFSYCYYNNINYNILTKDECILHRCDRPSCVNPEHLFKGTHIDNMKDKVIKGRQAKGELIKRKLTPDIVNNIRDDLKNDIERGRYARIAIKYNITYQNVSYIDRGFIWKTG